LILIVFAPSGGRRCVGGVARRATKDATPRGMRPRHGTGRRGRRGDHPWAAPGSGAWSACVISRCSAVASTSGTAGPR